MDNKYLLIEVHQLTRTMVSRPTCLLFGQQLGPPPPPPWVLCHYSPISPSIYSLTMRLLSELPLIEGCYRSTMIMYFFLTNYFLCLASLSRPPPRGRDLRTATVSTLLPAPGGGVVDVVLLVMDDADWCVTTIHFNEHV